MYKADIQRALERISAGSRGLVEGLIQQIHIARKNVHQSIVDFASNNDNGTRAGRENLQVAISAISKRIAEVSPLSTGVELHQLGKIFDEVMDEYPEIESLLQPGRQAVSELTGAFDMALQQNRKASSVAGLIRPALELADNLVFYRNLVEVLNGVRVDEGLGEYTVLEVSGANRLNAFADFVALLSDLAIVAHDSVGQLAISGLSPEPNVRIESIESGSPVRIKLGGGGRTLRFLIAMLRDVVRASYLRLTQHGQAVMAMETYAYAKKLGIDSPVVLGNLQSAMERTTKNYASGLAGEVDVKIDGVDPKQIASDRLLPPPSDSGSDLNEQLRLNGPKNE